MNDRLSLTIGVQSPKRDLVRGAGQMKDRRAQEKDGAKASSPKDGLNSEDEELIP